MKKLRIKWEKDGRDKTRCNGFLDTITIGSYFNHGYSNELPNEKPLYVLSMLTWNNRLVNTPTEARQFLMKEAEKWHKKVYR